MPRKAAPWTPKIELDYYFTPTIFEAQEIRKARIKNHNLPILQKMWNGNESEPLKCLISGAVGWKEVPCFATGKSKLRFTIDMNHIRQRLNMTRKGIPGNSADKDKTDPSTIFRYKYLDAAENLKHLIEFMTIMPVSREIHRYITQDSAIGHLTLKNFDKKYWPWVLKTKRNFDSFCAEYNIPLEYKWFIDHLSNIDYENITNRVQLSNI